MASLARRFAADFAPDSLEARFRGEVLAGLSQEHKTVPARWFYDLRGSELFEQITELPEYYPTRTEIGILEECCGEVAGLVGHDVAVVEFGAGSAAKTPLLLDCLDPGCYVPVDISGEFLRETCRQLEERYPALPIFPIEADFVRPVPMPRDLEGRRRLGFFPGSTIGNLEPAAAVDLLRGMRETLGEGSYLLIGFDRIKPVEVLRAAYDDAAGITAEFNLNLAHRLNRELDGTIPVDALRHRIAWNEPRARIEMHLEATRDIAFTVCGRRFTLRQGETIHTENSHKYDPRSAGFMLLAGGWEPVRSYSDASEWFTVILARAVAGGVSA
jgi:L-histidine Nalpha-methyltransferase